MLWIEKGSLTLGLSGNLQTVLKSLTNPTGQAAESASKCQEQESSIAEYQSLLQEASRRYGALEDQYEKDKEGKMMPLDF